MTQQERASGFAPVYFQTLRDAQELFARECGGSPDDYPRNSQASWMAAAKTHTVNQYGAIVKASAETDATVTASVERATRAQSKRAVPDDETSDPPGIVALEIGDVLSREFPPKEAFLAPWLRRQDLAMVYAKRGVGKTHFCLALAYAVASGGTFLGWTAPQPRRVLYIDGEMPGATMKDRLSALAQSQQAEPPEGFFRIVTPDVQEFALPDLATKTGQIAIASTIGDAELIILDNLSCLMRAGAENEGEAWVPMADWALARRREGRAVLFVHHAGKNGLQRGSSRREDLLDLSIQLKHPGDYAPEQGARFDVVFEKSRGLFGEDVQSIEASLSSGPAGQSWTWRKADGAASDRILELHSVGMKPGEIATELGMDRSTVYRKLKAMGVSFGGR